MDGLRATARAKARVHAWPLAGQGRERRLEHRGRSHRRDPAGVAAAGLLRELGLGARNRASPPTRVLALILASARLGGRVTANKVLAPVFRVAYGAERSFWAFRVLMPMAHARMMGLPRGYRPTPDEREALQGIRELNGW